MQLTANECEYMVIKYPNMNTIEKWYQCHHALDSTLDGSGAVLLGGRIIGTNRRDHGNEDPDADTPKCDKCGELLVGNVSLSTERRRGRTGPSGIDLESSIAYSLNSNGGGNSDIVVVIGMTARYGWFTFRSSKMLCCGIRFRRRRSTCNCAGDESRVSPSRAWTSQWRMRRVK